MSLSVCIILWYRIWEALQLKACLLLWLLIRPLKIAVGDQPVRTRKRGLYVIAIFVICLPMKQLGVLNLFKHVQRLNFVPIKLEFGSVGFWGEGKTEEPTKKPLIAKENINNKLYLHMMSGWRQDLNLGHIQLYVGGKGSCYCATTLPKPSVSEE